jgi:hypothetical protein
VDDDSFSLSRRHPLDVLDLAPLPSLPLDFRHDDEKCSAMMRRCGGTAFGLQPFMLFRANYAVVPIGPTRHGFDLGGPTPAHAACLCYFYINPFFKTFFTNGPPRETISEFGPKHLKVHIGALPRIQVARRAPAILVPLYYCMALLVFLSHIIICKHTYVNCSIHSGVF